MLDAGLGGLMRLLLHADFGAIARHLSHTVQLAILAGAAAVLGTLFHRLAVTSESLAQRNRELKALQELRAREAVRSERTWIAGELHDVVAHHVSAIVVRAQAADHVGDTDPGAYRDAFRWIALAGRESLDVLRSLVRVLRDDDVETGEVPSDPLSQGSPPAVRFAPQPGLAELATVVERVRGAGLNVTTQLPEVIPDCSSGAGLAVVRVAQEALTNVLVHSGADHADLQLAALPEWLMLQVNDPGPARPHTDRARRHGLVNMHERAAACGGEVTAGPAETVMGSSPLSWASTSAGQA